ncbi:dihydroorotase-like protein [Sphaerisporangium siamense]|uniref:Dihydropyrimidinase/allantoinase n=1 Tax=Sphaerisporangium siamense TaxID=795645 RepID=A0A7W7GD17_9ACTN|nr:amidohydrolase family protein [Sphaerisporangium siamense]MBB4704500.1 dihydropyrimidinase/allantoinase [Sphaerisporangium siamense]GII86111.1 dihydroorotase-like protein [Sphaerisporangium siamense]
MSRYDLLIKGGTVVLPYHGEVRADLAVRDGKVAALADDIAASEAGEVVDAAGKVVLPGAVDAHFHLGIYRDLALDAYEETRSSLVGGATTVLSYFRTGSHYLERTGPYKEIFPEVLDRVAGRAWTDYGFHLAPMTVEQISEIPFLVEEHGVTSFKYYMFYKGFDLAANSRDARAFTMGDEYDLGHLYLILEQVAAVQKARPDLRLSLSLHCEQSELMRVFIDRVRAQGDPQTLRAYHEGRPPLTERVAIGEATTLASHTGTNVNLLHLSSQEAIEAVVQARGSYGGADMRAETTLHHLCLDHDTLDARGGLGGKVNPPIRTKADNEALWRRVADGTVDWVASDHACCMEAEKGEELWPARPGFGGTALLYPVLFSEGHLRRGLSLTRVAELASANPARAYNLWGRKGSLAVGFDADLTVVDPGLTQTVTTERCLSGQDHCPFEGVDLTGWPVTTVVGGQVRFRDGDVVGEPAGRYAHRA